MEPLESKVHTQLVSTSVLLQDERSGVLGYYEKIASGDVTTKMRAIIVDWLMTVTRLLKLGVNSYMKGVAICETCLARMSSIGRNNLQLLGATSLLMAAKYEEIYPPGVVDFARMMDWAYSKKEIRQMEVEIFKTLGCSVSIPTDMDFLRVISTYSGADSLSHNMARLTVMTYTIEGSLFLPSVRATASAYIASLVYKRYVLVNVFRVPNEVVKACAHSIVQFFRKLAKSTLAAYKQMSWDPEWPAFVAKVRMLEISTGDVPEDWLVETHFKPSLEIALVAPLAEDINYDLIGRGSFGQVKKVSYLGSDYAVKVTAPPPYLLLMKDNKGLETSFLREVSIMQSLSHENVVKIFHISSDLSSIFLELGTGDAEKWIEERGPLDYEDQLVFQSQMLEALVYIHSCGVLHRDIKPKNIIVYADEEGDPTYKLTDFGAARGCDISTSTNAYTTGVCTVPYRSPEIMFGSREYGDRLDVWSMMCTIYEMSTGVSPFHTADTPYDEIGILLNILLRLGTPKEDTWPGINELPNNTLSSTTNFKGDPEWLDIDALSSVTGSVLAYGFVLYPLSRPTSHKVLELFADLAGY